MEVRQFSGRVYQQQPLDRRSRRATLLQAANNAVWQRVERRIGRVGEQAQVAMNYAVFAAACLLAALATIPFSHNWSGLLAVCGMLITLPGLANSVTSLVRGRRAGVTNVSNRVASIALLLNVAIFLLYLFGWQMLISY